MYRSWQPVTDRSGWPAAVMWCDSARLPCAAYRLLRLGWGRCADGPVDDSRSVLHTNLDVHRSSDSDTSRIVGTRDFIAFHNSTERERRLQIRAAPICSNSAHFRNELVGTGMDAFVSNRSQQTLK